jgi:hypothetical protein
MKRLLLTVTLMALLMGVVPEPAGAKPSSLEGKANCYLKNGWEYIGRLEVVREGTTYRVGKAKAHLVAASFVTYTQSPGDDAAAPHAQRATVRSSIKGSTTQSNNVTCLGTRATGAWSRGNVQTVRFTVAFYVPPSQVNRL